MTNITSILLNKISKKSQEIEKFFAEKFSQNPPLFYNSVDLRHSGFKIAPVDTNCYPAGFNNLSESSKSRAIKLADEFFAQHFPEAKKVLIIPENHTRNLRYLENISALQQIISAKREVVLGSIIPELTEPTNLELENGHSLTIHPLIRKEKKLATSSGFEPDVIVLNNDLTDGIPEILRDVTTPISPSPLLGWHHRTKSHHFEIYNRLAEELAKILEIDPWLISSMHRSCHDVDFKQPDKAVGGIKCLSKYVDELIAEIKKKYQEFGIAEEPYCFIKADNGTYGIAVWPVSSGEEVLEINKKERNKMNMLKGSVQVTQVMIQEGIKTIDQIDNHVAEPMIYMIGGRVVSNIFRINESRDEKISLNSAGAHFSELENLTENQLKVGVAKNEISEVYSVIARLAALAAAIEAHELQNPKS